MKSSCWNEIWVNGHSTEELSLIIIYVIINFCICLFATVSMIKICKCTCSINHSNPNSPNNQYSRIEDKCYIWLMILSAVTGILSSFTRFPGIVLFNAGHFEDFDVTDLNFESVINACNLSERQITLILNAFLILSAFFTCINYD